MALRVEMFSRKLEREGWRAKLGVWETDCYDSLSLAESPPDSSKTKREVTFVQ